MLGVPCKLWEYHSVHSLLGHSWRALLFYVRNTMTFDAQRTFVDERKTWHSECQRNMRLQDKRFPQQELSICLSVSEGRPVWADWKLLAPFQAAQLKLQGVKRKLKRCTSLWPLIGRVYGLLRVKLKKQQMQWNKHKGCGNTSEESLKY